MNNAAAAYQAAAKTAPVTPRQLEAELLRQAAGRLARIRDTASCGEADRVEALRYNRRLWTILVTSATGADSPLPLETKNAIGSLGMFVLSRSVELELATAVAGIDTLIRINRELADGLGEAPATASAP